MPIRPLPVSAFASVLVFVLVLSVGCEQRPFVRADAVGAADDFQRAHTLVWGSPIEVLPPVRADADGRRWWQLRYADATPAADGASAAPRLILVDDAKGWARLPPAGYTLRVSVLALPTGGMPVAVQEGSWILLLAPPAQLGPDATAALEREATRLNAQAATSGIYPLFSVRHDRVGLASLIYGWQGDRGITRDEHIAEWLQLRTVYRTPTWIDLLAP